MNPTDVMLDSLMGSSKTEVEKLKVENAALREQLATADIANIESAARVKLLRDELAAARAEVEPLEKLLANLGMEVRLFHGTSGEFFVWVLQESGPCGSTTMVANTTGTTTLAEALAAAADTQEGSVKA